jgi:hypothetical protein
MNMSGFLPVGLPALLRDLGKFWQRGGLPGHFNEESGAIADEFSLLFPYQRRDDIRDGAGNHQNGG